MQIPLDQGGILSGPPCPSWKKGSSSWPFVEKKVFQVVKIGVPRGPSPTGRIPSMPIPNQPKVNRQQTYYQRPNAVRNGYNQPTPAKLQPTCTQIPGQLHQIGTNPREAASGNRVGAPLVGALCELLWRPNLHAIALFRAPPSVPLRGQEGSKMSSAPLRGQKKVFFAPLRAPSRTKKVFFLPLRGLLWRPNLTCVCPVLRAPPWTRRV